VRKIFWAVFECVLCARTGSLIVMSAPAAAGRPAKSSPRIWTELMETLRTKETSSPSFMSNFRPTRGCSDKAIAAVFASGVAKSTYANLHQMNDREISHKKIGHAPSIFGLHSRSCRRLRRHIYSCNLSALFKKSPEIFNCRLE